MGRQDSLTAMALGRGHYEEEVVDTGPLDPHNSQMYDRKGYPRNPQTRRHERDQVRAANEVMQVTGVVEDALAAQLKAHESMLEKNEETLTGLRLMEVGRAVLVAGVWGVMGFRRRILLYRPYAETGLLDLVRQERAVSGIPRMLLTGLPAVVAYHALDMMSFFCETVLDALYDEEEGALTDQEKSINWGLNVARDVGFSYFTLHCRLFAVLQQLHLIPATRWIPSLLSFIPFSSASPLSMPPLPSLSAGSLAHFGVALFQSAAPLLFLLAQGQFKHVLSRIIYRPIYKTLPRPTGDSMFSGLPISAPTMEYDSPDCSEPEPEQRTNHGSDEPLRPGSFIERNYGRPPLAERERARLPALAAPVEEEESGDDEELAQATLISFDVEATERAESSLGTWSAELRSANEPSTPPQLAYRVTGLTMLPPIMATEGLREMVASILSLPVEAYVMRKIGRAFRASAGAGTGDMYPVGPRVHGVGNLLAVFAAQLVATGVVWAGFTLVTQWGAERRRRRRQAQEDQEGSTG
ncbi:hypothetical protein LZ554_009199 [Drepanopeziza brunnea f. sp. 'monogermtubi']|nr:hypothetical protein LZ554_009199 [Drepanopeziza brunnea f. sp. 'monogermtubi']